MVKPNDDQIINLNELKDIVVDVMLGMGIWSKEQLAILDKIPLGVLRKNATQRHGVTRWKIGVKTPSSPTEVEVIDLHPELLTNDWKAYGAWVLHHEYIHALGFTSHNSEFRQLEHLWPSPKAGSMGLKFTEFLRRRNAKWLLRCDSCNKEYPRQKPGNGRLMCRKCRKILVDVPITRHSD